MTEAQKCLYHIAENMRMAKSISKEGYEYFQQAIKALEQTSWIPVSERLPELNQFVLCKCRANITEVLKLTVDGWYHDTDHCYMDGFVLAWMPLPQPYKAESEVNNED